MENKISLRDIIEQLKESEEIFEVFEKDKLIRENKNSEIGSLPFSIDDTRRVVFWTRILSNFGNLTTEDKNILIIAAQYHAIAYDDDEYIDGKKGVRLIEENNLLNQFTDEQAQMIKFIIEHQSRNEKERNEALKQLSEPQRSKYQEMFSYLHDAISLNTYQVYYNDVTLELPFSANLLELAYTSRNEILDLIIPENLLGINYSEKKALQIYQGQDLGKMMDAYAIMNMLMFPGLIKEKSNFFNYDYSRINPEVIRDPKELIDIVLNMYSAMYKYGRNVKDEKRVFRVESTDTTEILQDVNETISFMSTTEDRGNIKYYFDEGVFVKNKTSIVEIIIPPNTPYVDFSVLEEGGYDKEGGSNGEEEILIAPFLPIDIEEEEIDEDWIELHDLKGNIPKKQIIKILPQEDIIPLSKEEEEDKKASLSILYDEEIHSEAIAFLEDCKKYKTMEDALAGISPERVEKYLKWKEAFQKSIRYLYREVALDIDRTAISINEYIKNALKLEITASEVRDAGKVGAKEKNIQGNGEINDQ